MFIVNLKEKIKKIRTFYYTQKALRTISSLKTRPTVNHFSVFNNNIHIGRNCNFNGMNVSGGGEVIIGDNFHSGSECSIITQNHNIHGDAIPYDDTYILKNVVIEDNVWIGNRVIILGGVKVGEGAVIQAGSVVVSDIPPLAIAGGHPAKVFSSRCHDHYYQKLKDKKFY